MTIEKLDASTPDLTRQNIARLAELFPECVTEGPLGSASDRGEPVIDFDLLRQALSDHLVEGPQERYRLDWPGKRQALLTANAPIDKTLRPIREDSVDFDTTRNLFIEGDNLDALKLLQETYLGKVKMIYLDPPYNTGRDFIYKDNFAQSRKIFEAESGQRDEDGGRLVANPETNGRFHSDWMTMMYPRLKLARNLLTEDGVMMISIDENEFANLRHLMDQIFGPGSLVGVFKWNKTSKAPTLSKTIRNKYEFVFCYQRGELEYLRGPESYNEMAPLFNSGNSVSTLKFPVGSIDFHFGDGRVEAGTYGTGDKSVIVHRNIEIVDGVNTEDVIISARFKWSQSTVDRRISDGQRLAFKTRKMTTMYYYLETGVGKFIAPSDLLSPDECGVLRNDEGYSDITSLFDNVAVFDYAKPSSLGQNLCKMIDDKEAIVVDMFSGSGSTLQGVIAQNIEDGGRRRFIGLQIAEPLGDNAPAKQFGLTTIADLARERIRRAGKRFVGRDLDIQGKVDVGFRAFRVDEGNLRDVRMSPNLATQATLDGLISHIKDDRNDEDLLFGALLRWGVDITLPMRRDTLQGRTIWIVDPPAEGQKGAALVACFARPQNGQGGIDVALADELAAMKPLRVLFRDDGFVSDAAKENIHSRFKQRAPDTDVRVL